MTGMTQLAVAGLLGASGGLVMLAILMVDGGLGRDGLTMTGCATAGAAIAGLLCAPLFGHRSGSGAFLAILGAVTATLVGAALGASLFALPKDFLFGAVFGPVFVASALVQYPVVGGIWVVSMAVTHLATGRLRQCDAEYRQSGAAFRG